VSEPTADEFFQRLAAACAEIESCTLALIYLELGELYTGCAPPRTRPPPSAMSVRRWKNPGPHLAALDRAITDAEGRCVQWSEKLAPDNDPDIRAEARRHYEEWSREVDAPRETRPGRTRLPGTIRRPRRDPDPSTSPPVRQATCRSRPDEPVR
jgi:hypothetical protein